MHKYIYIYTYDCRLLELGMVCYLNNERTKKGVQIKWKRKKSKTMVVLIYRVHGKNIIEKYVKQLWVKHKRWPLRSIMRE